MPEDLPDSYEALAKSFTTLSTPTSRDQALQGLVRVLSREQKARLLFFLEARHEARHDFMSKLPLEIVQAIFTHLPLYQIFRCQRLSKKWAKFLSSSTDAPMRCWFPNAETPLRIPQTLPPSKIASLTAEHIDAYRNGTPFSRSVEKRFSISKLHPSRVAYADGIIAWITADSMRCRVYYIESGIEKSWVQQGPAFATHIAVSATMVTTVLSSGQFCARELPTLQKSTFSLISNSVQQLVVSGDMLAVLYFPSPSITEAKGDITTWMIGGDKCHFRVQFWQPGPDSRFNFFMHDGNVIDRKIVVNETTKSVVLIEKSGNVWHFTRFDSAGTVQASGDLKIPDLSIYDRTRNMMTTRVDNCAVVGSFMRIRDLGKPEERQQERELRTIQIKFNLTRDQLEFQTNAALITNQDTAGSFETLFTFKDVTYFQKIKPSCRTLYVTDREEKTYKMAETGTTCHVETGLFAQIANTEELLCGDETYLISMHRSGFCVWCFDKNITMANEDRDFKQKFRMARAARWMKGVSIEP